MRRYRSVTSPAGALSAVAVMILAAVLMTSSCIFDSPAETPAFPSVIDATVTCDQAPELCKYMQTENVAMVAAGTELLLVNTYDGSRIATLNLPVAIDDISDSDAGGYGYVLADSLLYPVDLSAAALEDPVHMGMSCSFISLSPGGDRIWAAREDDSISTVDLSTMKVTTLGEITAPDCQGMATSGNLLMLARGSDMTMRGYEIDSWTQVGSISVPGEVKDLYPGVSGYICAVVEGSNELWYIRVSTCSLYKMITFPEVPVAAASMIDGSYAFGSCPNAGFLIIAENGETVHRTLDMGIPSYVDVSAGGETALVCSPDKMAVYMLVK